MADSVNGEGLLNALSWRYATKQFDPTRKIQQGDWNILEQSLILAPSSYGLQPWKALVVQSEAVKQQLPAAAWGQTQPAECSHFVVLAARRNVDREYVISFIQRMADVRGVPMEKLDGLRDAILSKTTSMTDHLPWTARQCYIALGFLLQSAALLKIDACPMEGIIPARVDELLGLAGTDYTAVVACALGYRSASDKYASAPKVRPEAASIVQHL